MKLFICLLLITITVVACNNGKVKKQENSTDTVAISKIANFPGTIIYIELPKGFAWDETALGFYRDEDGSVIRYDEFKTKQYAANMPVEERIGSLTNRQPITVSGYKGEIKTYQVGNTSVKIELSFGDDTFMEFIEATYFTSQEQTEKDILSSLKTIEVKKK